jgi:hypothetical protein
VRFALKDDLRIDSMLAHLLTNRFGYGRLKLPARRSHCLRSIEGRNVQDFGKAWTSSGPQEKRTMQIDMFADNIDDERRAITTIFWLVLVFAFAVMMVSVGAAWAYLMWAGILESGQIWLALLVLGIGILAALASLASIIAWLIRENRE